MRCAEGMDRGLSAKSMQGMVEPQRRHLHPVTGQQADVPPDSIMPEVATAAIVAALDEAEAAAPSAADEFTTLRWVKINVVMNSAASTGGDRGGPSTRGPPSRFGSSEAEARQVLYRWRCGARPRRGPAMGETCAATQLPQFDLHSGKGAMKPAQTMASEEKTASIECRAG